MEDKDTSTCQVKGCTEHHNGFSSFCDEHYDGFYGLKGVNFNQGGMERKQIEDIRCGSLGYPNFIIDNDKNIIYGYQVVCSSGMADNDGIPKELTIYKTYPQTPEGNTKHEKFEYVLKSELDNKPKKYKTKIIRTNLSIVDLAILAFFQIVVTFITITQILKWL